MVPNRDDATMHMLMDAGFIKEYFWGPGGLYVTLTERGKELQRELHDEHSPFSAEEMNSMLCKLVFAEGEEKKYRLSPSYRFEIDGETYNSPMESQVAFIADCPFCVSDASLVLFTADREYHCMVCGRAGEFRDKGITTIRVNTDESEEEHDG